MFSTPEWFKQSRPLSKGQRNLKLGNEEYVSVMVVGLVESCFYTFTFIKLFIYSEF